MRTLSCLVRETEHEGQIHFSFIFITDGVHDTAGPVLELVQDLTLWISFQSVILDEETTFRIDHLG